MQNTEENIKNIQSKIELYEKNYHRLPHCVKLMAVSKKKPQELIEQVYASGQRIFGESYLQEAMQKIEALQYLEDIQWHFIGPIQSNKTRDIANHFNWVHSVDRLKIMKRLNDQRDNSKEPLNVCLQVNIDNEASKSGFTVEEIDDAARQVLDMPNLKLRGLMAIPKPRKELIEQRRAFKKVQQLFTQLKMLSGDIDTLSMGMSGDIEAAIAEGSTMVRVGTAIFGSRE